jgi:hypothetical protein
VSSLKKQWFLLAVKLPVDGRSDAARLNDTAPRYLENSTQATFRR